MELRPESYGWSVIQALLSRSDRRLAPVIAAVRGSQESLGGWKKAYRAARSEELPAASSAGVPLPPPPAWEEVVHHTWADQQILPWCHLDGPLPSDTLLKHQRQALSPENAPESAPDSV